MAKSSSIQFTSIYLFIILLGCRHHILQACPLPSNASCNDCQVLRYIQLDRNRELNINLTVPIDLGLSQNTANNFARVINSEQTSEDFFFEAYSLGSVASCLGSDPNAGSPCTHNFRMAGSPLPTCRWNYTCDYSPNRFPQYIWKAECMHSAHPIFYSIPTLTLESDGESGCLPFTRVKPVYRWGLQKVPVACSCTGSNQQ